MYEFSKCSFCHFYNKNDVKKQVDKIIEGQVGNYIYTENPKRLNRKRMAMM
ncbi:MAG: hypothetical protein KA885_07495 [Spirochaetes bacterium]|nr:hypothetical protein [Spirochaetota bacterium]